MLVKPAGSGGLCRGRSAYGSGRTVGAAGLPCAEEGCPVPGSALLMPAFLRSADRGAGCVTKVCNRVKRTVTGRQQRALEMQADGRPCEGCAAYQREWQRGSHPQLLPR
jgi:hypothetical protein